MIQNIIINDIVKTVDRLWLVDQLSTIVYFNENYLFIISKTINIYIKHNHKQGKSMCEQRITA